MTAGNPAPGYLVKGNENIRPTKAGMQMFTAFICNHPELETTQSFSLQQENWVNCGTSTPGNTGQQWKGLNY